MGFYLSENEGEDKKARGLGDDSKAVPKRILVIPKPQLIEIQREEGSHRVDGGEEDRVEKKKINIVFIGEKPFLRGRGRPRHPNRDLLRDGGNEKSENEPHQEEKGGNDVERAVRDVSDEKEAADESHGIGDGAKDADGLVALAGPLHRDRAGPVLDLEVGGVKKRGDDRQGKDGDEIPAKAESDDGEDLEKGGEPHHEKAALKGGREMREEKVSGEKGERHDRQ